MIAVYIGQIISVLDMLIHEFNCYHSYFQRLHVICALDLLKMTCIGHG